MRFDGPAGTVSCEPLSIAVVPLLLASMLVLVVVVAVVVSTVVAFRFARAATTAAPVAFDSRPSRSHRSAKLVGAAAILSPVAV